MKEESEMDDLSIDNLKPGYKIKIISKTDNPEIKANVTYKLVKEKFYKLTELEEILGVKHSTLRTMIPKHKNKKNCKYHFPHARMCECGNALLVPRKDIMQKV